MTATSRVRPTARQVFLLDHGRRRSAQFAALRPEVVTTAGDVRRSIAKATKSSLWVSYASRLTDEVAKAACGPSRTLGKAVFLHALPPQSLPALAGCFQRMAFAQNNGFLPADELAAVLDAENAADLFLGGSVDSGNGTITLWRGNLEPLTVPFSAFERSGDGLAPDFTAFSITDSGQTVRLGDYEAATEALLYEFDPESRRRMRKLREASDRSFGAALRRLRKQRGLRREDFEPDVASKTIARIERGQVGKLRKQTLASIARRLRVAPEDIGTY